MKLIIPVLCAGHDCFWDLLCSRLHRASSQSSRPRARPWACSRRLGRRHGQYGCVGPRKWETFLVPPAKILVLVAVVPTYLAECAPPSIRGRIVSINSLLITGGQVVAYLVDAAFYNLPHGWRWMVLAGGLPALVQLVGLFYLDESPRWLVAQGRHTSARHVLSRIYPLATPEAITHQIVRIEESVSGIKRRAYLPSPAAVGAEDAADKSEGFGEQLRKIWRERGSRKALLLACGLQACQQLVGANSVRTKTRNFPCFWLVGLTVKYAINFQILYYSSRLLLMAGFKTNPNVAAIWIAIANFAGTAIALRLIDRVGRRTLLLRATAGATVALACLALALGQIDTGEVTDSATPIGVEHPPPGAWTYICLLAVSKPTGGQGAPH